MWGEVSDFRIPLRNDVLVRGLRCDGVAQQEAVSLKRASQMNNACLDCLSLVVARQTMTSRSYEDN